MLTTIPLRLNIDTVTLTSYYDFTHIYTHHSTYGGMYKDFILNMTFFKKMSYYTYKKDVVFLTSVAYIYDVENNEYIVIRQDDKIYISNTLKKKRATLYKVIREQSPDFIETDLSQFILNLNDISFKSLREKKSALEEFKNYEKNKEKSHSNYIEKEIVEAGELEYTIERREL